jgi:zinc protease
MRDALEVRFAGDTAALGAGLAAMGEAVREPITGAEIETARRAALAALERAESDPDAVSMDLFREKVFAGHPYAHRPDGTPAGLKAIAPGDVAAFGARVLSPGGAVLAIVGDVDGGAIVHEVEQRFRDWKGGPEAVRGREPAATPAASGDAPAPGAADGAIAGEYTRQMRIAQARVIAGVPGVASNDADFTGLRALGAGVTLLAFDDLVFRQRTAFSAVSVPEAMRAGGTFAIALTTPPQRAAEALFDLQRLLRRVAAEPLSAEDVRDIGRVLAGREAAANQSAAALASGLAWRVMSGAGVDSWRRDLAGTVPDASRLQALAEARIRQEKLITVVVGPPEP